MRILRALLLTGGLVLAESQSSAQFGQMPGIGVGKPVMLQPVGNQLPQVGTAVPRVGSNPTGLNMSQQNKQDPFGLNGLGIKPSQLAFDPKDVISPYPQMPNGETSFWDRVYDRWLGLFGMDAPATRGNWTPGLSRRNKERREAREFRRD